MHPRPHPRLPTPGLSHVQGATLPALADTTLFGLLAAAAARDPDGEAAVFLSGAGKGTRWTWAQLASEAECIAAGLWRLGVRAGDRVALRCANRPEALLLPFAVARLGALLVTLDPAYRAAEQAHALRLAQPSLLVCEGEPGAAAVQAADVLVLDRADAPGRADWAALRRWGRDASGTLSSLPLPQAGDAAVIFFTSGTTGTPKGATLSHRSLVNNARSVAANLGLSAADRVAVPVPLHHCFGLVLSVLASTASGAAMVFPAPAKPRAAEQAEGVRVPAFDAAATLDAVQAERCSVLHGVPAMFLALLRVQGLARRLRPGPLRTGLMAGAACPPALVRQVRAALLPGLSIAYGMTETGPVSFQTLPGEAGDDRVGRLLPHLEARVVDAEGRTVPLGERGELCVRGYALMRGYWQEPERSAEALRGGWMHTGDLALLDPEGRCRIVGRVRDLVLRGEHSVFPQEVEAAFIRHPKVAAVQVFGVPDAELGEELCAWVVPRPGTACSLAELRRFCHERLAPPQVPRHIRVVDCLPVTVNGKPRKFVMRDAMMRELGMGLDGPLEGERGSA
jgi:fatty-acyl-CoA synthase